ncbi:MAG: hypothetical protein IKP88_00090 [Lachnospiraceae bacterium]|nr:hypothetical protein [Lachnospiraceae bacterium]
MTSIFIKLLNLSISAGMLVLLVFAFRLFLKRYSRRAACLLWIVVALRLIIPFSFESSFSIMPSGDFVKVDEATVGKAVVEDNAIADTSVNASDASEGEKKINDTVENRTVNNSIGADLDSHTTFNPENSIQSEYIEEKTEESLIENTSHSVLNETDVNIIENTYAINQTASDNAIKNHSKAAEEDAVSNSKSVFTWLDSLSLHTWEILAYIWLLGAVLVFVYMVIAYARMRSLTAESIPFNDTALKNVYICDMIDSAFILGVVKPRIYLPGHLTGQQVENILAHEQVHLKRKDYIWKFIGFVLLMVYWFNPLMWVAYAFLCKDIEFACDEKVISDMNPAQIREYSDTLLVCSADRHFVYGCPLAFGEVAVKDRIKAALSYKKPLLWVIMVVFVLLVGAAVFFFAKPSENIDNNKNDNGDDTIFTENPTGTEADPEEYAEEYKGMGGGKYYKLKDGTYKYGDYSYKYRLEITGRMPNATNDSTFVYLSNIEDISFERAWKSEFSSNYGMHFNPDEAVLVEMDVVEDEFIKITREEFNKWQREIEYNRLEDGTYEFAQQKYKYRFVISGRLPGALCNTTYEILSNIEDISFRRAWLADGFSSNMDDYFSIDEAVIVRRLFLTEEEEGIIKTDLYQLQMPEKWVRRVNYTIKDDNTVVVNGYVDETKKTEELLKIVPVMDVDTAWEMLDEMPGRCIFSKDYVYVFIIPDSDPQQKYKYFDLRIGTDELLEVVDSFKVLKDGETRNAFNSIRTEHLDRIDNPEMNKNTGAGYEKHYLGIYDTFSNTRYGLKMYDFSTEFSDYRLDETIIKDGEEVLFAEYPDDMVRRSDVAFFPFKNEINGNRNYAVIAYGKNEKRHEHQLIIEERPDNSSNNLRGYKLDYDIIKDYVLSELTEKIDTDANKAYFNLNDGQNIVVESEYDLVDKNYDLLICGIDYWNDIDYVSYELDNKNLRTFSVKMRAGLACSFTDGTEGYEYDFAPLVSVNVEYVGEGKFDIRDISIRRYGLDVRDLDFSQKEVVSDSDYVLKKDPETGTQLAYLNPYVLDSSYKTQNFRVMKVNSDGTIVLRATGRYLPDEYSIDQADDYENPEGLYPMGTEVTMKLSKDCIIYYFPKFISDWELRKITVEDLKYLSDNYYYMDRGTGGLHEYLYDFECSYRDGVVYYIAEHFYP